MAWKCYSCGTENSKKDAVCTKCGNTVAAPKRFYSNWIWGAALFFVIFYLAGTMAGGVIVEAVATPDEKTTLHVANQLRKEGDAPYKSVMSLPPELLTASKAVAVASAKAAMSPVLKFFLQWSLSIILFVICGLIVGFISDGWTIIEPAIGSVIGHAGGVALLMYVIETDLANWFVFGVGVVPGIGLAILGAFIGEKIQEKKERAGGITA